MVISLDLVSILMTLSRIAISLLLCAFCAWAIRVDPETSLFVDQYGRFRVYHGVNAVFKTEPFYPITSHFDSNYSLSVEDLANLREWGFNTIRLHVAWEGVMPSPNYINYTYIETLREIVRMCAQYDIQVLFDAHQDLFSKKLCGQGFPDWAVERNSFPAPLKVKINYDENGYPQRKDCLQIPFSVFYTTFDIMQVQQDFFTNKRGLLDRFAEMWQSVAAYMQNEPNLLGYELINEPIGSNIYHKPGDTLSPGVGNNKFLLPAYRKLYKAIRLVDRNTPIFFEPSVIDPLSGGFYETPGGEDELERQVFSYHVYCPTVTAEGEPTNPKLCKTFDALEIASKELNLKRMRIGGMLTEFGALSNTQKSADQVTGITSQLDRYFRSWTYWQFKYYNDITTMANPGTTESFYNLDGSLQTNKIKALSRPYVYAICGKPISTSFSEANGLKFKWVPSSHCFNKFTEVYLNEPIYFAKGFEISFKHCNDCRLRPVYPSRLSYYYIESHSNLELPIVMIVTARK